MGFVVKFNYHMNVLTYIYISDESSWYMCTNINGRCRAFMTYWSMFHHTGVIIAECNLLCTIRFKILGTQHGDWQKTRRADCNCPPPSLHELENTLAHIISRFFFFYKNRFFDKCLRTIILMVSRRTTQRRPQNVVRVVTNICKHSAHQSFICIG